MKKIQYTLLLLILSLSFSSYAQEESNLERFTPSTLFGKGTWEINSFYNLYTQRQIRDREGSRVDLGQRQTFLNANYQFTYGISKAAWINIGFDVQVIRAFYDNEEGSPLKVLFSNDADFSRTVVSAIGPRIKLLPIRSIPNLSIQSSFLIPVAKDLESPSFTAHDRYSWWTQIFYDQKINDSWRIFLEVDALYRLKRRTDQVNFIRFPMSAFLSYFPSSKSSIFLYGQYAPRFERQNNGFDEQFGLSNWFTQLGIGAKYQISPKIGLEFSYGDFISSRLDGAGYTLNFGLRYIH